MVLGILDQEKLNRCKVSPQTALAFENKIKMTKTLHRALDIKIEKLTKNIGSGVGHFYSGCTGLRIVHGKAS